MNTQTPAGELFPRRRMLRLILPLIAEQTLAVTIGMLDTVMVSAAGEAAISGVSLVDQINILLINIFSALTTGGAVVAAQYMGRDDRKNAGKAAKQLFWLSGTITSVIMAVCLIFNHGILRAVYGAVEPEVMSSAEIYFYITCVSYPALGIYNSGAALFRSMGNSPVSMITSLIMNVINLFGNALLIYGFGMGAAGAAWATLASRTVGAVIMLALMCRPTANRSEFRVERIYKPETDPGMIKSILKVGLPNGAEGGMFQIGKLLVANLITTFGTASIAANAVSNTLAGFAIIPGSAIGLAMVTVVGQCVGAGDYDQAKKYTFRLMSYTYIIGGGIDLIMFFAGPEIVSLFNISPQAKEMAEYIVRTYALASFLIWSLSFSLPNSLRAAGDARFTMVIAIISMWVFRIGFSYLLCGYFDMGLNGVWYAMYIDWIFRSAWYIWRFLSGRWKYKKVIS